MAVGTFVACSTAAPGRRAHTDLAAPGKPAGALGRQGACATTCGCGRSTTFTRQRRSDAPIAVQMFSHARNEQSGCPRGKQPTCHASSPARARAGYYTTPACARYGSCDGSNTPSFFQYGTRCCMNRPSGMGVGGTPRMGSMMLIKSALLPLRSRVAGRGLAAAVVSHRSRTFSHSDRSALGRPSLAGSPAPS